MGRTCRKCQIEGWDYLLTDDCPHLRPRRRIPEWVKEMLTGLAVFAAVGLFVGAALLIPWVVIAALILGLAWMIGHELRRVEDTDG